MNSEAPVIDTVARYFFFVSLDEQLSFTASLKALADLRAHGWLESAHRARWVEVLTKWKPRVRGLKGRMWPEGQPGRGFPLPRDFDLVAWTNFLTSGEPSEVEAVLLSQILGFEDGEIASGLGVTVGTVRYRVGRGLRHLGVILTPETDVKNKRLTKFLCHELLYEYVRGTLDPQRKKDMDEYIAGDRDSQRELERLRRGLAFTAVASQTQVAESLREAMLNFEPHWQKQLREWTLWSSERGWKMLPYIFVVLTLVLGIVVWKPWRATENQEVVLAEQLKHEPDMLPPATVPPPVPKNEAPEPLAKEITPALAASQQPAPVTPPSTVAASPPVPSVVKKEPEPTPKEASDRKIETPAGSKGELIRGEIDVSDFANTWPAIRDKIIALGGKVAGSVELGWLRTKRESYFHFSLPESNYAELELFLGTFGPVRFSREKHPRIMPKGQVRIILTVKDTVTDEATPEAP